MRATFHVMARAAGSRAIFHDRSTVLRVVRRIAALLGPRALWFAVVDTHAHYVVESERSEIRRVARDMGAVLRHATAHPFEPVFVQPIESQRHLANCWPYVVDNAKVHGVRGPIPEGCGLMDILGARRLPGFDRGRWTTHRPRVTLSAALSELGLPPALAQPAGAEDLGRLGASRIGELAAAVAGLPDLFGRTPAAVSARYLAIAASLRAGIPAVEIQRALGVGRHTVWRATDHAVPMDAILRQCRYQEMVEGRILVGPSSR